MTIVNKEISLRIPIQIEITEASLMTAEEADTYLGCNDRKYQGWWWLSSPGSEYNYATYVKRDGSIDHNGGFVEDSDCYVRPVLKCKNLVSFDVGDTFKIKGNEFKVIYKNNKSNEGLAWLYKDSIGRCPFRKTWKSQNASDYNSSTVKRYINKWYKDLIS